MKTVLTFIAVLFFGVTVTAQSTKEIKVEPITKTVELDIDLTKQQEPQKEVARLYRYKNSRIKKELAFRTKRNRAKLA
ncbi:hypothetical protein [Allomuricauda sp. d1]|uniref:hypothetical protein n=1 Tax=Allomuricauda sp. d1 TaxID=3136725 RepID=UPI0031DB5C33